MSSPRTSRRTSIESAPCACDKQPALAPCEKCKEHVRACLGPSFEAVAENAEFAENAEIPSSSTSFRPLAGREGAALRAMDAEAAEQRERPPHIISLGASRHLTFSSAGRVQQEANVDGAQPRYVRGAPTIKLFVSSAGLGVGGSNILIAHAQNMEAALHNAHITIKEQAAEIEKLNEVPDTANMALVRAQRDVLREERNAILAELNAVRHKLEIVEKAAREDRIVHDNKSKLADKREIDLNTALETLQKTREDMRYERDDRRVTEHQLIHAKYSLERENSELRSRLIAADIDSLGKKRKRTE